MGSKPKVPVPPTVHIELFVVPRTRRNSLRRRSRAVYRAVRGPTQARGGLGPLLFLLEAEPRHRRRPKSLRRTLGVRTDEELWLELAFYASRSAMRTTLRELWDNPRVVKLVRQAEEPVRKGPQSWSIATGELTVA